MAMSELKQKILLFELAKVGFPDAAYIPESGKIKVLPEDDRSPFISDEGNINYGIEHEHLAINTLRPIVDSVNESVAAWEMAEVISVEEVKKFRVLVEYNNVLLAARNDTEIGRGFHFVTWRRYDAGVENGFYTEDYNSAKENFASRAGLVSQNKLFTQEQAAEIQASIAYRIENDGDLTYTTENELGTIAAQLRASYPIPTPIEAEEGIADNILRRYMDIDLEHYLGKISEKIIIHYPKDWTYDVEHMKELAQTGTSEDKRLVWHVCSHGTHLKNERDMFIKETGPHSYMTDYRQSDLDMFGFYIEVTGIGESGAVRGNVFEVGDYAEFAKHIREISEPLDSLTLIYSDQCGVNAGKTITVSRKEYDTDRTRLMSESGNVKALVYHPKDKVRLASIISDERSKRMAFPIGNTEELLQRVTDKLAEVRKPPEIAEAVAEKPKTLAGKMQAANEKVKAQDEQNNNKKTRKREERK